MNFSNFKLKMQRVILFVFSFLFIFSFSSFIVSAAESSKLTVVPYDSSIVGQPIATYDSLTDSWSSVSKANTRANVVGFSTPYFENFSFRLYEVVNGSLTEKSFSLTISSISGLADGYNLLITLPTSDSPIEANSVYRLTMTCSPTSNYMNNQNYIIGGFSFGGQIDYLNLYSINSNNQTNINNGVFSRRMLYGNSSPQYAQPGRGSFRFNGRDFRTYDFDYNNTDVLETWDSYESSFQFINLRDDTYIYNALNLFDMTLKNLSPTDKQTQILTEGWENSAGTPELEGKDELQSLESDMQNQETGLLVGFDINTGEPIYETGDSSTLGRRQIEILKNVIFDFFDTQNVLLGVNGFLSRLFNLPKINTLLYISLSIGIFSLIFGVAHNIVSSKNIGKSAHKE